jgi:hypothetical protein
LIFSLVQPPAGRDSANPAAGEQSAIAVLFGFLLLSNWRAL